MNTHIGDARIIGMNGESAYADSDGFNTYANNETTMILVLYSDTVLIALSMS